MYGSSPRLDKEAICASCLACFSSVKQVLPLGLGGLGHTCPITRCRSRGKAHLLYSSIQLRSLEESQA